MDYDPSWPESFLELHRRYIRALDHVPFVAIEHVGSTAVEGLAAKPVIDIDIVVAAAHVDDASKALERIGFQPLGDLGIPERWAFREPPDAQLTNTYVVVAGSLRPPEVAEGRDVKVMRL